MRSYVANKIESLNNVTLINLNRKSGSSIIQQKATQGWVSAIKDRVIVDWDCPAFNDMNGPL